MDNQPLLHYMGETRIGDVHPFFDCKTGTWYMYYLEQDLSKLSFAANTRLITSKDLIHWTPTELKYDGRVPAPFHVIDVMEQGGRYLSWYGRLSDFIAVSSEDLIHWKHCSLDYSIPVDKQVFPSKARDAFIFYDPDERVYRCIATAYKTNEVESWGSGEGMDCMWGLASTRSDSPNDWRPLDTIVKRFDGFKGEPECTQVRKIGGRWYIFASMGLRHPNHVGQLVYLIGDEGAGFTAVNWAEKEEHVLTGQDLCAAQLAFHGDEFYLFGWIIENWNAGVWGGHLSFPYQVYRGDEGILYTRLAPEVSSLIRGKSLGAIEAQALSAGETLDLLSDIRRYDVDVRLLVDPGTIVKLEAGNVVVKLDATESTLSIMENSFAPHTFYTLPEGALLGTHDIRIVAENDIVELFLDEAWSLSARIKGSVGTRLMRLSVEKGLVTDAKISLYRLKTLAETLLK